MNHIDYKGQAHLDKSLELIQELYKIASEYAKENNIEVHVSELEDDNWHGSMYLRCWTKKDWKGSSSNGNDTFKVWHSYTRRYEINIFDKNCNTLKKIETTVNLT